MTAGLLRYCVLSQVLTAFPIKLTNIRNYLCAEERY